MAKPSPMTRRLARQTETDLKKLAVDVEKRVLAIGGREHMAQQVEEDAWNL